MATIDVSGRTIKSHRGKSRLAPTPKSGLVASDHGLLPEAHHSGMETNRPPRRGLAQPSNDLRYISGGINSLAPQDQPRGRKHVEVTHEVVSEDAKRQQGRIGVRKVHTDVVASSPLRPTTAPTVERKPGVERMRLCTAEQQARRKLERIVAHHRELQPVIEQGIARGGNILVDLEKKIQKQLMMEASRENRSTKSPEAPRPRTADLGNTKLVQAPFALDNLNQQTSDGIIKPTSKRSIRTSNTESASESVFPARFSKKIDSTKHASAANGAPPFDTALQSAIYPDPPVVGVVHHVAQGKGHIEFSPQRKDIDEELHKKAVARCHFSSHSRDTPLMSAPPSTTTNVRPTTLRETMELKSKVAEEHNLHARKGKTVSEQKYRSTALW